MRTFLAIDLPATLEKKIKTWMDGLKREFPDGSIRWVESENLHLTLKFLGEVEAGKIGSIRDAAAHIASRTPVLHLEIAGFGAFPSLHRPRVVWLGVEEETGGLEDLHLRLNQALLPLGFESDHQGFTPHLTLGRVRRRISRDIPAKIGEAVQRVEVGSLGGLDAHELVLYKSTLRSPGAVHEAVDRLPFEQP